MKCDVFRDLLPLYCDKLTSEESNALVEEHLRTCTECREAYRSMQVQEQIPPADRNIQPLRKVRRVGIWKGIFGAVIGEAVLAIVFVFAYVGIIPARFSDVTVTPTAEVTENGDLSVTLSFEGDERFGLRFRTTQTGDEKQAMKATPLYTLLDPFESKTIHQNEFSLGWVRSDGIRFTDEDVVTVHFLERDVVYNLKEIAEEAGIQ